MQFWLGVHHPNWLSKTSVPLMISHRRLRDRKTFPRALGPWFLDSGGFTQLSTLGYWDQTVLEYVEAADRYVSEIGNVERVAPMDWMCEPWIVQRTGLSVSRHQRLTTQNFLDLRQAAPDLPVIPVLQGWAIGDYAEHVEIYAQEGVDLFSEAVVGIGSVCRRQATKEIEQIILSLRPLRLHGFGVKKQGLLAYGQYLASADSMAWSFAGRRSGKPCGNAINCANHLHYALEWRDALLA